MKNNNSIKPVVAVGIGAALFFVLGRFVAIPSPVPNTNISLQYAVLALLAAMYGPVAGGLIGFIGHALIDLSWGQRDRQPDRLDRGCSRAGHPDLCGACQKGVCTGRVCRHFQQHYCCGRGRPAGAGLHQDHCQERLFG